MRALSVIFTLPMVWPLRSNRDRDRDISRRCITFELSFPFGRFKILSSRLECIWAVSRARDSTRSLVRSLAGPVSIFIYLFSYLFMHNIASAAFTMPFAGDNNNNFCICYGCHALPLLLRMHSLHGQYGLGTRLGPIYTAYLHLMIVIYFCILRFGACDVVVVFA